MDTAGHALVGSIIYLLRQCANALSMSLAWIASSIENPLVFTISGFCHGPRPRVESQVRSVVTCSQYIHVRLCRYVRYGQLCILSPSKVHSRFVRVRNSAAIFAEMETPPGDCNRRNRRNRQ